MDEGILEVSELAGDRVVELRAIDELHVVGLITYVVEDLVVGDEAPVGGVAQVIGHGVKVGVGVHGEEGRRWMPFFTGWSGASSCEVILARQSRHSSTRASASCRKLQMSPFEHCPLAFHCQQSPRLLCSRCSVP